jgi:hypothetical protein
MKKFLSLGMAIMLVLSVNQVVYAQVKIDKFEEYVDVAPGKTASGSVLVGNTSDQEITVKAYVEDLEYIAPFNDGSRKAVPLGSTSYSIGKYMVVDPALFVIPANGSQKVLYTIKAPQEAKGGYYGVIFFEKALAPQEGQGFVIRYGCKIYAESQNKVLDVKMEDMQDSRDGFKGNFSNNGDVILLADVTYIVIDDKGMVFDRGSVCKELSVPPQQKAAFQVALSQEIPAGSYTLIIDFSRKNSGVLAKEVDFSKDEAGVLKIDKIKD